jgi:hypothetical protein
MESGLRSHILQPGISAFATDHKCVARKFTGCDKIPGMPELALPAEVGIDPFTGQSLIIRKLPQGWMVYSVR